MKLFCAIMKLNNTGIASAMARLYSEISVQKNEFKSSSYLFSMPELTLWVSFCGE